jgi:hypothetical protein
MKETVAHLKTRRLSSLSQQMPPRVLGPCRLLTSRHPSDKYAENGTDGQVGRAS